MEEHQKMCDFRTNWWLELTENNCSVVEMYSSDVNYAVVLWRLAGGYASHWGTSGRLLGS